ncbi:MAG: hypothetical protein HC854_15335 [Flavobacterium sp.]|nr:hypothetical protein [Flavobacterium sp.]
MNTISINTVFKIQPIYLNATKKTFSTINFTSFNNSIGVEYNYIKTNKTYKLSSLKSTINLNNRNNISSFNPNGVSTISAALIIGTLNLIFSN